MISSKVTVNSKPVSRMKRAMDDDLARGGTGPIGQAFNDWARYQWEYLYGRFYVGGGDKKWRGLSYETVRKKGHGIILVETSELHEAFNPTGHPAQVSVRVPNGIVVSLKGGSHSNSKLSLQGLAELHQKGIGVPVRQVFVSPSEETKTKMHERMVDAVKQLLKETKAGQ